MVKIDWPCFAETPEKAKKAVYIIRGAIIFMLAPAATALIHVLDVPSIPQTQCEIAASDFLTNATTTLVWGLIANAWMLCLFGSPETVDSSTSSCASGVISMTCGPGCLCCVYLLCGAWAIVLPAAAVLILVSGNFLPDEDEGCREGLLEGCHTVALTGDICMLLAVFASVAAPAV